MKKLLLLLMAAMMSLSLVACGESDSEPTEGTTGGDSDTTETIKIGNFGPQEGAVSIYGIAVRNGIQLAVDDFNADQTLLGKKVELVSYDSKAQPTDAVNALNKLVDQDEVVAIIGGVTSGESVAAATASVDIGIPMLSPSATTLELTSIGDNIFRGCYTDPYQAKALAEYALKNLDAKTAAVIYNTSDAYSVGIAEAFVEAFTANGGEIVAQEGYVTDDKDFNAQLTTISGTNPDVLLIPDYYQAATLITKQARALGIEAQFLGGDGWDGIIAVNEGDTTAFEGAIFSNHYSPEDPAIKDWIARYEAEFGIAPNAFSFLAYDSTNIMLQAIEEADSTDYAAINGALLNIEFDGLLGYVEFDENGEPQKDAAFVTIKDGAYVTHQ